MCKSVNVGMCCMCVSVYVCVCVSVFIQLCIQVHMCIYLCECLSHTHTLTLRRAKRKTFAFCILVFSSIFLSLFRSLCFVVKFAQCSENFLRTFFVRLVYSICFFCSSLIFFIFCCFAFICLCGHYTNFMRLPAFCFPLPAPLGIYFTF